MYLSQSEIHIGFMYITYIRRCSQYLLCIVCHDAYFLCSFSNVCIVCFTITHTIIVN